VAFRWRRRPPTEESIRQVAEEIYQNRLLLNRPGDDKSDWATAEKIANSPLSTTLFATNRPLIKLEKRLVEPLSKHLRNSAVFDIVDRLSPALEAIGVLLIPLVLYLATQAYEEQREGQEIERLQQETVSNYLGQLSDIFLNAEGDLRSDENRRIRTIATASTITLLRDPNLDGQRKGQVVEFLSQMELVQGEAPSDINAYGLRPIINLTGADLDGANLSFTDLRSANLTVANL